MKTLFLILSLSFTYVVTSAQSDTTYNDKGVGYVVLEKGEGKKPVNGQQVKVLYVGKLTNGKVFDESLDPFKYTLGDKGIIPGWNSGIAMMNEGDKGVLIIPAAQGYGAKGAKNDEDPTQYDIPPNSDLIFEMQLLKVK